MSVSALQQQRGAERTLLETVINGGYCIGCGACASLPGSPLRMVWNRAGLLEATTPTGEAGESDVPVNAVCPFSDASIDEDRLAVDLFSTARRHHPAVGRYLRCYVGAVADARIRAAASSGGLGRFIAASLLTENLVDQVLHVAPNTHHADRALFTYHATSDPEQVLAGSKSAYYPVTLADISEHLFRDNTTLAVVGLPCFVKALRLMARVDSRVARSLKYTIGLFCGGLRSARYAEMIAWQMGIHPTELTTIDFREKYRSRPANHKGHRVLASTGLSRLGSSKELFGTDYGMGFFKPKACDHCDDVTAELADVSVGDAWLPDQIRDPKGTSALVVRSPEIGDLLERQRVAGELVLEEVGADTIAASQASGIRHRREGTRYRSDSCARIGVWSPPKRDFALPPVSARRRAIYEMREKIRVTSDTAFSDALRLGCYHHFEQQMRPLLRRYRGVAAPFLVRLLRRISGLVGRLLQA
jgi:coenzyme F420 hydrogenase subunit beta